MPLWGKNDNANSAPKFRVTDKFISGNGASGATPAYDTSVRAMDKMVLTVAAADNAEVKTTRGVAHSGWQAVRRGTGPLAGVTSTGGLGYANGDVVKVSNGTVNAVATMTTNSTGGPSSFVVTTPGAGFINASLVSMSVANSTGGASAGTGATFTIKLGGRAGRVHYETLVAGGIVGTGSDDFVLP